jgi:hypothetical protein
MNISSLSQQLPNKLLSSQESHQAQLGSTRQIASSTQENGAVGSQTLAEKRHTALQVVDEILTSAYQKLSSRGLSASETYQAFEPLTAEKVANNILGFIERRLKMDQAEGATQEELEARLEAGLSGFKKGFAEAEEKLKALEMLSPEIAADIGKTYTLVTEGIDKLREQLLGGVPQEAPVDDKSLVDTAARFQSFGAMGSASARDFSYELTTREGDKVRINASASQSMGLAYNAAVDGDSQSVEMAGRYSSSQSFSLEIQGDLSEEELGAINELLGKVNSLADDFYAGNLDEAWNQALSLGFDQEQISEYSLSLTQVEVQVVQTTEFMPDAEAGVAPSLLAAQGFMKSFLEAMDLALLFPEPFKLLKELAEGVDSLHKEDQPESGRVSFADFIAARLAEIQ